MYIKLNSLTDYKTCLALAATNGFRINQNLSTFAGSSYPEFVFICRDQPPLVTPHLKMVIWAGTNESVGTNYWTLNNDSKKITELFEIKDVAP